MDVHLRGLRSLKGCFRVVMQGLAMGVLMVAAVPGQDEIPLPVFDLAPGQVADSGFSFVAANDGERLLFWADDGRRGRELWITDGTEVGTRLWAEICPGECTIDQERGQRIGDVVFDGDVSFFLTEDGVHGKELWTSDGTVEGTRLVADICPGDCDPQIRQLALIDGKAYFEAWSSDSGSEPWISDGTRQGTRQLADLTAGSLGSFPQQFVPFGDGAAFLASSEETAREWWQTDGTPEGTELLADLCPGDCSIVDARGVPWDNGMIFAALITESQQYNFYRATPGQTPELLETLCEGPDCGPFEGPLMRLGDRVYVTRGNRVWSTDGTTAGTRVEVHLPNTIWQVLDLELLGDGTLLLLANDDSNTGYGIYRRNAGGVLSAPLLQVNFRASLHSLGDQAVVVNPTNAVVDLWSTDGTAGGTVLYEQIHSDGLWGNQSGIPTVSAGRVVLSVRSREDFQLAELVSTGGSATTLRTLWEVEERPVSFHPSALTSVGSFIVFRHDAEDRFRDDLWSLDEIGNVQLLAAEVEPEDLVTVYPSEGPRAFFASGDEYDARTPWLTNGSPSGTFALESPDGSELTWGREPVVFNGELFFLADQGAGQKFWKTGVEEGSVELIVDLQPDYENIHFGCPICSPPIFPTPIFPRELHVMNDRVGSRLVFVGGQDESGAELWLSDGTEEGTALLFDLVPGSLGSEPENLLPAGFGLIFTADLGQGQGRELFLWDGQSAQPEALGAFGEMWAATYDGVRAVWIEYLDGEFRLRTSDGTLAGTRTVATLPAVPERSVFLYGERVFFAASDERGAELWVAYLDRSGEDVLQRFDLWPGDRGSFPRELQLIGDQLYFSADDGLSGRELWRLPTQRILLEPYRLGEIVPGEGHGSPRDMALLEPSHFGALDQVLFSADDGETGRELWAIRFVGDSFSCRTDATQLCLRDGRFRVTVNWRDEIRGTEGVGRAIPSGDESGLFWFFGADNFELTVKVIDGRDFNDAHWFFYGALSDVAYDITVEDLATGARRIYNNAQGNFCGQGDIEAFPETDAADLGLPKATFLEVPGTPQFSNPQFSTPQFSNPQLGSPQLSNSQVASVIEIPAAPTDGAQKTGGCVSNTDQLCLLDRFLVTVDWTDHDGNNGQGQVLFSNGQTGTFWFFDQRNIELVVKAIDGTGFNDSFWIFYGALTDVEYALRVVDTLTGNEVVYQNPAGNLCGRGDTSAFPRTP